MEKVVVNRVDTVVDALARMRVQGRVVTSPKITKVESPERFPREILGSTGIGYG